MPNGVSCAYFALKNYKIGKKDENLFRTGIAGAQTTRTIDCVTKATPIIKETSLISKFFGRAAALARKIVYPLIIGSGVYTTFKSDDKVKTGVSQGLGIASMYSCERVAERILKSLESKILNSKSAQSSKPLRIATYVLKGCAYAASSIFGFNVGNKIGSKTVDSFRNLTSGNANKYKDIYNPENMIDSTDLDDKIFDDIENKLKQNSQ